MAGWAILQYWHSYKPWKYRNSRPTMSCESVTGSAAIRGIVGKGSRTVARISPGHSEVGFPLAVAAVVPGLPAVQWAAGAVGSEPWAPE